MNESERIARLMERFSTGGPRTVVGNGDDAAVNAVDGGVAVTSIDAIVEGVHFDLERWPPKAIGHKAVAAALSDLAAMGAESGEIYVAAGIPRSITDAEFEGLCDGIAAAADASGALVAGGDLSAAGELWVTVTVVGYALSGDTILTRSGAQPDDVVVVTGDVGASHRALDLIAAGTAIDDPRLKRQFEPQPRFAASQALVTHGATAMIDVSDGIARDAGHVATASGVALRIELDALPLAEGITDSAFAAASGEEYELLATIPPQYLEGAIAGVQETGIALTAIGRVAEGSGADLLDAGGAAVEIRGFDHFD